MIEHLKRVSIDSYYVGDMISGVKACEKVLSYNTDFHTENQARINHSWYNKVLIEFEGVSLKRLHSNLMNANWTLFNPTIHLNNNKIFVFIRSSNYEIINGRYKIKNDSGIIETKYICQEFDESFTLMNEYDIKPDSYNKSSYPADGIEDIRVFGINDKIYATGTIRNMMPYTDYASIALTQIDIDTKSFTNTRIIDTLHSKNRHEKNWMPVIGKNPPEWIYSCNENGFTTTIRYENKSMYTSHLQASPTITKGFRGGSQLVPYGYAYLAIIHEVALTQNGLRIYLHRFVRFNADHTISDYSLPFSIVECKTIEFVAGLTIIQDILVITAGLKDKEAILIKVPISTVEKMFTYRRELMNEDRSLRHM